MMNTAAPSVLYTASMAAQKRYEQQAQTKAFIKYSVTLGIAAVFVLIICVVTVLSYGPSAELLLQLSAIVSGITAAAMIFGSFWNYLLWRRESLIIGGLFSIVSFGLVQLISWIS